MGPPIRLLQDGNFISSPSGLATTLNNYFINKVKKLRASIPVEDMDPLTKLHESMVKRQCSFNLKLMTEQKVPHKVRSVMGRITEGEMRWQGVVSSIEHSGITLQYHKIWKTSHLEHSKWDWSNTLKNTYQCSEMIPIYLYSNLFIIESFPINYPSFYL